MDRILAKDINFFYVAVGDRTIIADPNYIVKMFSSYKDALDYKKEWLPEDGAAIYVIYKNEFLLIHSVEEKTGNFLISLKFPMDLYETGVKKVKELIMEGIV